MSLDWNVANVKDYDTVCLEEFKGGKRLQKLTHDLIWATILVGLGTITEKNVEEWLIRLHALHKVDMLSIQDENGERYVPCRAQLVSHIGLRTNASNETRRQFEKKILSGVMRYANTMQMVGYHMQPSKED